MLKNLTALAALVGALVVAAVLAPVSLAVAAEDDYGPRSPTSTLIDAEAELGEPVEASLRVTGNDGGTPSGTLDVTITTGGSGGQAAPGTFRTSREYDGGTVTVEGPVARADTTYVVTAEFSPDNPDRYLPSANTVRVSVDDAADGGDPADDTGGAGGLPNTGGPHLWWLLVGIALVGSGTGAVVYTRRHRSSTPATA